MAAEEEMKCDEAPREINFVEFVGSRCREMEAMMMSAGKVKDKQRIMQQLPRLMRRRAASHDVRRLPLKLRMAAKREMNKSGPASEVKHSSRKHRRRPRNLLADYARRKRNHMWLETHIWHAKRFHMANRWGYRIPSWSNDRGTRAAYRTAANRCLISDISYLCCIEVTGRADDIMLGLNKITHPATGCIFSSRAQSGRTEGRAVLYSVDSYPRSCLGEISFIWNPSALTKQSLSDETLIDTESVVRQLWIWCHPVIYESIYNELRLLFGCSEVSSGDDSTEMKSSDNVEPQGFTEARESSGESSKKQTSVRTVRVESLKDKICRFRLIGARTLDVLRTTLRLSEISESGVISEKCSVVGSAESCESNGEELMDETSADPADSDEGWWVKYYRDDINMKSYRSQKESWSKIISHNSPAELPQNFVIGLTVRDPRLSLPAKKSCQRLNPSVDGGVLLEEVGVGCSDSLLWLRGVREEVKRSMLTVQQINDIRAKAIIPEESLPPGMHESRIPVLLIQRPGVRAESSNALRLGYGCGFDIILPAGWSTAFWISFIYGGAMAAGLTELHSVELEMGGLQFPSGYPDTAAGQAESLNSYKELASKYNRMPPSKCCNFEKLGVASPYHFPWKELTAEWMLRTTASNECMASQDIYCIRDVAFLAGFSNKCNPSTKKVCIVRRKRKSAVSVTSSAVTSSAESCRHQSHDHSRAPCLVPVSVEVTSRGVPVKFSHICIPLKSDLEKDAQDPVELIHESSKPKSVKKSKGRRDCFGNRIKLEHSNTDLDSKPDLKNNGDVKKSKKEIYKLSEDKPDTVTHCTDTSSRLVIGYVVDGGFSYTRSRGVGLGFVSLQGLQYLIREQEPLSNPVRVLVRSASSRQYRTATLSIRTNL